MVSDDISTVSEIDDPFAEVFWQILHKPPKPGMGAEEIHTRADRVTSPLRGSRVLFPKKIPQPLQIPDRGRRIDYSWHFGAGSSFSVPQLASH